MAEVSNSPFSRRTTGVPNADDILLGRGELFAAELTSAFEVDADGWRNMGNCPELTLEPSSEFIEHYSSRGGFRTLDKKIMIQQKFDLRFGIEEAHERNVALFMSATPEAYTNAAIAGFTEYEWVSVVELGASYELKSSGASGTRALGVRQSDLVLKKGPVPGSVTLVANTDYELDSESGMIFFKSTATNIVDGDKVTATLTARAAADTTRRIPVQSRSVVTVALKFRGVDPDSARKYELVVPKITLAAVGGFGLVTQQEWLRMGFTGAAEKKDASTAIAYIYALPAAA